MRHNIDAKIPPLSIEPII